MLKVDNAAIGYMGQRKEARVVLSDINLVAHRGELVAIVGRNGSGKSTLLKTIVNQLKLISGQISFTANGTVFDLARMSTVDFARKVAFVSTEAVLVDRMTVFELVAFGRYPHTNWFGRIEDDDRCKIEQALVDVGLADYGTRFVNELSDGEKQRAMIARTLAQDTDIIVLDEPTAFLDLPNKYDLAALLAKLAELQHKVVIFSTHDLNIARQFADKIWLFVSNRIIEGAPEDLILDDNYIHLFDNRNLVFDKLSGEFYPQCEPARFVRLIANEPFLTQTRNALARVRIGICEADNCLGSVSVKERNKQCVWTFCGVDSCLSFNDIYSLIRFLRHG